MTGPVTKLRGWKYLHAPCNIPGLGDSLCRVVEDTPVYVTNALVAYLKHPYRPVVETSDGRKYFSFICTPNWEADLSPVSNEVLRFLIHGRNIFDLIRFDERIMINRLRHDKLIVICDYRNTKLL